MKHGYDVVFKCPAQCAVHTVYIVNLINKIYKIKIKVTGYDSGGFSAFTLIQFRVALTEGAQFSGVIRIKDKDDNDNNKNFIIPEYDGCESIDDPGDSFYQA